MEKEIKRLRKIVDQKRSSFDFAKSTSFEEFENCAEPEQTQLCDLLSKQKLTASYTLSKLSDYGDLMTLKSFVSSCKGGMFIDYDGYGYYVKDNQESDITVHPSEIISGVYRKDFSHIIWFNR